MEARGWLAGRSRSNKVEQAADDLRERGLLTDTGPDADGRRSSAQWLNAVREDAGIVHAQLESSLRAGSDPARCIAVALRETRRMQSDIYRFAQEVHGLSRAEVDQQRR
jgi:hypothetical protein